MFAFSKFLYNIKEAFDRKADLQSLLVDEFFAKQLNESQVHLFNIVVPVIVRFT